MPTGVRRTPSVNAAFVFELLSEYNPAPSESHGVFPSSLGGSQFVFFKVMNVGN